MPGLQRFLFNTENHTQDTTNESRTSYHYHFHIATSQLSAPGTAKNYNHQGHDDYDQSGRTPR